MACMLACLAGLGACLLPTRPSNSAPPAEHGSWNRELAIGYRIAVVQVRL